MQRRAFKQLLEQAAALAPHQQAELAGALHQAGRRAHAGTLIDALAGRPPACPRCQWPKLHRHGHAHGLQRYRCLGCARSFNALTGTPLARLRQRAKWLPYFDAMLASDTVRHAARRVGIHKNTSFRWRHRFLALLKHDRRWPLGGITEADETYLLESQKGSRRLTRPARRRGGRAARRGISGELDCILVARDRDGRTLDCVTGRAPLTGRQLTKALLPRLAKDCLLVSDGHAAYRAFAREAGLAHRCVVLRAGVRVNGAIHVQNVNAYHSRFKQWLARFHGVASRYLGNYLGWRWAVDAGRISSAEMLLSALVRQTHTQR